MQGNGGHAYLAGGVIAVAEIEERDIFRNRVTRVLYRVLRTHREWTLLEELDGKGCALVESNLLYAFYMKEDIKDDKR